MSVETNGGNYAPQQEITEESAFSNFSQGLEAALAKSGLAYEAQNSPNDPNWRKYLITGTNSGVRVMANKVFRNRLVDVALLLDTTKPVGNELQVTEAAKEMSAEQTEEMFLTRFRQLGWAREQAAVPSPAAQKEKPGEAPSSPDKASDKALRIEEQSADAALGVDRVGLLKDCQEVHNTAAEILSALNKLKAEVAAEKPHFDARVEQVHAELRRKALTAIEGLQSDISSILKDFQGLNQRLRQPGETASEQGLVGDLRQEINSKIIQAVLQVGRDFDSENFLYASNKSPELNLAFEKFLKASGMEQVYPEKGTKINPGDMDAVGTVRGREGMSQKVAQVIKRGYKGRGIKTKAVVTVYL